MRQSSSVTDTSTGTLTACVSSHTVAYETPQPEERPASTQTSPSASPLPGNVETYVAFQYDKSYLGKIQIHRQYSAMNM